MKKIINIFAIIAICCLSNTISMNLKKMKQPSNEDVAPIVINIESGLVYAGLAGDDAPKAVFPTIVGRPKPKSVKAGWVKENDVFIGDKAISKKYKYMLNLKSTAKRGLITEWEDLKELIHHIYYIELKVAPEEHNVLMTISPNTPQKDKERVLKILFETFKVPKAYIMDKLELSLYASGSKTGTVLHIEEGVMYAFSFKDDKAIQESIITAEVGGNDLTEYLTKILNERGYSFNTNDHKAIVKGIKYKLGYVARDYEAEIKTGESSSTIEKSYELPDGQVVTVGNERFKVGEALFQPKLMGKDIKGIHEMINDSIQKSPESIRGELYSRIIVSGDTMFPGIQERLQKEISALANGAKVKVFAYPERKNFPWLGGSMLTTFTNFEYYWITPSDYKAKGISAIIPQASNLDIKILKEEIEQNKRKKIE